MLTINTKKFHVTQKIGIKLRMVKKDLINTIHLIKYHYVQLCKVKCACANKQ